LWTSFKVGRGSERTLRGTGETLGKVPQAACVRSFRVRDHVSQAAACCTSKDAGNVGHPLARLRRVAPDWPAVSISGSSVKSHNSIDSRSIDKFVSQQVQSTAYVRYCFISLVFTCRFLNLYRLSAALRRSAYRLPPQVSISGFYRQPSLERTKDVLISTYSNGTRARGRSREKTLQLRQLQPMPEYFQSDVMEPIWWRRCRRM
jgi:hypothetical protein